MHHGSYRRPAIHWRGARRLLPLLVCIGLAAPCAAQAQPGRTFACHDTLNRADGARRTDQTCELAREYCYEATGGPAYSHGAHCRPLPNPRAGCAELVRGLGAGSMCSGSAQKGFRVDFVFP